jgi:outer membrane scaffolding protein for murein synthesis (MipA/OmpV family)
MRTTICRPLVLNCLFLAVAVGAASSANAQQGPAPGLPTSIQAAQPRPPAPKAWVLTIGFAPVVAPAWQGSRETALSVFPDLRVNYRDSLFLSIPDGLGWNAVNTDGWKLGPLAKIRFGRQESNGGSPFLLAGGSDALRGFGNVNLAGEFGGFAQKTFAAGKLRLRAEVRHGVGGHDGLIADTNFVYANRSADMKWIYSAGVRATWADSDYTNVYFGVSPEQALAAGLPESRTGAGLVSAGLSASLTRPLGRFGKDGAVTLFTSADRLGDVVADSSLIRERGDRNQVSVGISYAYRFSWN